jgi:hypothetical protein
VTVCNHGAASGRKQNNAAKRNMTPDGFAMLGPDAGKLSGSVSVGNSFVKLNVGATG